MHLLSDSDVLTVPAEERGHNSGFKAITVTLNITD